LLKNLIDQKRQPDTSSSQAIQTTFTEYNLPVNKQPTNTSVNNQTLDTPLQPRHPAQDDPLTMKLLDRYLHHINRAKEYLEHEKGYEWDANFNVIGQKGMNVIEIAEK